MTEDGLKKSAPIILGKGKNPKVKAMGDGLNKLKVLCDAEDKPEQLSERLADINKLLNESDKMSSKSFIYKDLEDIMNAQRILIELATVLVDSIDKILIITDKLYYECLEAIFRRGEFDLAALCFERNKKKIPVLKNKIAVDYQKLLYRVLGKTLDDLQQKGLGDARRAFVEFFLSYAYFRVPEFRRELLTVLKRPETSFTPGNSDIKSVLVDWDKDFHVHINNTPGAADNKAMLFEILQSPWRDRFRKKGVVFFFFIKEWCLYIKKTLVVKNFDWQNIEGYDILVETFFEEFKKKAKGRCPDVVIAASLSLLANPALLDRLVLALISVTKLGY